MMLHRFARMARPQFARGVAKSAAPETPLLHYTATQQATSSINHRLVYVNVTAMFLCWDLGKNIIDW